MTPEIIMTNGSMAVFYVNNYKGWNCKEGDTLTFSFEKYKSETVQKQTFVIGYIVMELCMKGEHEKYSRKLHINYQRGW